MLDHIEETKRRRESNEPNVLAGPMAAKPDRQVKSRKAYRERRVRAMTEIEFKAQYPLLANHLSDNGEAFEGCLFETFGEELAFVQRQNPLTIWTLVNADDSDRRFICSGFHFINRFGYLISTIPFPEDADIEVQLSDGNEELESA